ncbi:hypothetical protein [Metabacillus sp. B2-18]|uniref:hypothetical protein n=1 Tax=Metabacillus sp. B2-18 TaxID=2897333 RepID=UPI001E555AC3|nr:hypothetical protein [Metabacillus sp. B2-18]UGB29971.1 hypothetical protein LPC09_19965 [Metabacillus sp. B2-18]
MVDVKYIKALKTIGGKTRLLKVLLPIINYAIRNYEINGFLDLFGGGNKFIPQLNKKVVPFRLYNELDTGISNVMACLSDWGSARELVDLTWELQKAIKTKKDFEDARIKKRSSNTPMIESAALTILIQEYSRAGDRISFCKENTKQGISYESLVRYKELVPLMQDVVITQADYKFFIEEYGHRSDFLCILDPPYVDSDIYEDSFPNEMHEDMVRSIWDIDMKAVLCGTDNPIYDYLVGRGWNKYFVGNIPKSSSTKIGDKQPEFIWTNMDIPLYLLPKQVK